MTHLARVTILPLALERRECQTPMTTPFPLDPRLEQLLQAVVEVYQETAQPVGSQTLVDTGRFSVSSATIRNWFADLDELGLLEQPHTSGGRIPTEAGYRVVLTAPWVTSSSEQDRETYHRLGEAYPDRAPRAKAFAKAMVEDLGVACFVRFGPNDLYYTGLSALFAQPEFRDWQRVVSLSEVLDRLDEAVQRLEGAGSTPKRLIGTESPFGASCSTVYGEVDGVCIGALGPLRMPYRRTHDLLSLILPLLTS